MATIEGFEMAGRRARQRLTTTSTALAARYDHRTRRIVIRLSSNLEVAFSPQDAQGLEGATPSELDSIEITPSGLGVHFPKLDADLYLPALLEGFLGSRMWNGESARRGRGEVQERGQGICFPEEWKAGRTPSEDTCQVTDLAGPQSIVNRRVLRPPGQYLAPRQCPRCLGTFLS